jgi:hypothetical protein
MLVAHEPVDEQQLGGRGQNRLSRALAASGPGCRSCSAVRRHRLSAVGTFDHRWSPRIVARSSSVRSSSAAARIGSTWSARPEADDRPVDWMVAQRPRDRDRAEGRVVVLDAPTDSFDEGEVLGQLGLVEAWIGLAPVVVGQALDPFARHPAGEQARPHRRVDGHADPVLLGVREDLWLDVAFDQRVLG